MQEYPSFLFAFYFPFLPKVLVKQHLSTRLICDLFWDLHYSSRINNMSNRERKARNKVKIIDKFAIIKMIRIKII